MAGKRGQKSTKAREITGSFDESCPEGLDGRVRVARTYSYRYRLLTNDLGGADQLSYQQRSLCKRVIHLELSKVEKFETTLAHGGTVDVHSYLAALNALSSLFSKLGLERRAKTVSLKDYLSTKPESDPARQTLPSPKEDPS